MDRASARHMPQEWLSMRVSEKHIKWGQPFLRQTHQRKISRAGKLDVNRAALRAGVFFFGCLRKNKEPHIAALLKAGRAAGEKGFYL